MHAVHLDCAASSNFSTMVCTMCRRSTSCRVPYRTRALYVRIFVFRADSQLIRLVRVASLHLAYGSPNSHIYLFRWENKNPYGLAIFVGNRSLLRCLEAPPPLPQPPHAAECSFVRCILCTTFLLCVQCSRHQEAPTPLRIRPSFRDLHLFELGPCIFCAQSADLSFLAILLQARDSSASALLTS